MSAWSKDFHYNTEEVDTPPQWVYNTDQNVIYYQKFPNCVYVDEAKKIIKPYSIYMI